MQYRPEIDGLRALAVLPVILFHGGFPGFEGGFVGVDVFFVISGYLITSILVEDLSKGRFSLLRFYERRARRILPALFFVMLLCLPFAAAWMLPNEFKTFGHNIIAVSLFASNILFWRTTNYFSPRAEENPLLHTWSLAVEEQFYIFFPLILWLFWRMGWRATIASIVLLATLSLGLSEWGWRNSSVANFYLLPTRAWELLAGSLCAFALRDRLPWNNPWLAALGLGLVGLAMAQFNQATPFPSLYGIVPVAGVVLIILYAGPDTFVGRTLALKPVVGIGLISYSAYLWHQPLFAFARLHTAAEPHLAVMATLAVLSLILAVFSWRYVEQPFRRAGTGILPTRRRVFVTSICGLIGFIILGMGLHASNGIIQRYPVADRPMITLDFNKQGLYIRKRFEDHLLRPFAQNTRRNILIIGDSYGQDLVNAIYETGLYSTINLATQLIPANCGNLLVAQDLSGLMRPLDRQLCRKFSGYAAPEFQELLSQADTIFLASSWRDWQVPFVEETVQNIQARTSAQVVVVGRKSFGRVKVRDIIAFPPEERAALRTPVSEAHLRINAQMARQNTSYINLHNLLCDARDSCPTLSEDGALLSHDGGHLTQAGAQFMGQILLQNSSLFRKAFLPQSIVETTPQR